MSLAALFHNMPLIKSVEIWKIKDVIYIYIYIYIYIFIYQLVERATTGQEFMRSIPAPGARSVAIGWIGVSIMSPAETEVMVSPLSLSVAARKSSIRQS